MGPKSSAASTTAGSTIPVANSKAFPARKPTATPSTVTRSASNQRQGCTTSAAASSSASIRKSKSFESYMGDALAVLGNTLDLGEMEFVEGQFKYSMRANWKLLVENSMDGYHAAYTHERFFSQWMPSEGLAASAAGRHCRSAIATVPLGNGHVTTNYPTPDGRPAVSTGYLDQACQGRPRAVSPRPRQASRPREGSDGRRAGPAIT